VDLFRAFDWDGAALGRAEGGPLFVARDRQGAGRHDQPERYGAWYCSHDALSAVAECIQSFRGETIDDDDFIRPRGQRKALVTISPSSLPGGCGRRRWQPSAAP
jgi:hypothetical protein